MTTVQPGEAIVLTATFTSGGAAAQPTGDVEMRIKPASGAYGNPVTAADQGGGVYEAETTAPAVPGLYVAKFTSADGGIAKTEFQVSED